LSMSRFVQKIIAIKSRITKLSKTQTNVHVFWPTIFSGWDDPNFSMADCYHDLLCSVWQKFGWVCLL